MTRLFSGFQQADKLLNLFRLLTRGWEVMEVDHAKARAKVRKGTGVDRTDSDWIPWLTLRGLWSPPKKGERVVLFAPYGQLHQAIIVAPLFTTANPAPSTSGDERGMWFDDGAFISFNHKTGVLTVDLSASKDASLMIVGKDVVLDADKVTITGDLDVDGAITAGGDISDETRSMAADRVIFNPHTHPVTGTTTGPTTTEQ